MGTGGTISGVGRYLKERNPNLKVVGVDPIGSVYTEYFRSGQMITPRTYKVEGIGEDFLPGTMDFSVVDEVVAVNDRESFLVTRRLVREEGIFCGGSSGTAGAGAVPYLRVLANHGEGKRAVIILPDSGFRYLSKVFSDDWMRENGFLEAEMGTVADLLRAKGLPLITATPDEPVRAVIAKMKQYDVSQLPVVGDGGLVGMVSEGDLLSYLLEGGHGPADPITPIVDPAPPVVTPDTPVDNLADAFLNANAAIVVDGSRLVGNVAKVRGTDPLTPPPARRGAAAPAVSPAADRGVRGAGGASGGLASPPAGGRARADAVPAGERADRHPQRGPAAQRPAGWAAGLRLDYGERRPGRRLRAAVPGARRRAARGRRRVQRARAYLPGPNHGSRGPAGGIRPHRRAGGLPALF